MGFLSGITGGLTGGGGSTSSKSGYAALPKFQQQALKSQNEGVQQFLNPLNAGVIDRFTPMGETADETAAYNLIRQGFTPTAEGLASDLQTLQNPYQDSVISEINRQSFGQNSMLQGALSSAGQYGSNRSILGANDIDLSRANTIGSFLSDNYNTNLGYALNTLPTLRAADATGLAGIGADQRALAFQQQQAPVNALQVQAGILAGFPNSSTSTQAGGSSGIGGLLSGGGGLLSGLSAAGFLGGGTPTSALNGAGSVGNALAGIFK